MSDYINSLVVEIHRQIWPYIKKGMTNLEVKYIYVEPGVATDGGITFNNVKEKGMCVVLLATTPEDAEKLNGMIVPTFFNMMNETQAQRLKYELEGALEDGTLHREPANKEPVLGAPKKTAPKKRKVVKPKSKPKKGSRSRKE